MTNCEIKQIYLSLFKQIFVRQEIQESDSQHTEFVLLAMNVITNNDNLTKVVSHQVVFQ